METSFSRKELFHQNRNWELNSIYDLRIIIPMCCIRGEFPNYGTFFLNNAHHTCTLRDKSN